MGLGRVRILDGCRGLVRNDIGDGRCRVPRREIHRNACDRRTRYIPGVWLYRGCLFDLLALFSQDDSG